MVMIDPIEDGDIYVGLSGIAPEHTEASMKMPTAKARKKVHLENGQDSDVHPPFGQGRPEKKNPPRGRVSQLVEVGGIEPPSEGTPSPALHA